MLELKINRGQRCDEDKRLIEFPAHLHARGGARDVRRKLILPCLGKSIIYLGWLVSFAMVLRPFIHPFDLVGDVELANVSDKFIDEATKRGRGILDFFRRFI